MKIKDLLDVDSSIQNKETGEIVKESLTSPLFAWLPQSGSGRRGAMIISQLATNRARIKRFIGPGSEYDTARQEIIEKYQVKRADGAEGWEWLGDTPEAKAESLKTVKAAIEKLMNKEVDAEFERVSLVDLFELGLVISAENADLLGFMLDTSPRNKAASEESA